MIKAALTETSVASAKYECWTYMNGHPVKMTYIVADSKSDAQAQAPVKFSSLGARWDCIKCH